MIENESLITGVQGGESKKIKVYDFDNLDAIKRMVVEQIQCSMKGQPAGSTFIVKISRGASRGQDLGNRVLMVLVTGAKSIPGSTISESQVGDMDF